MPTNPNALTLEDMQLERSQQAFFGQYGGFTPADTAGRPLRAAVSLAQGMNTESVAKDAAAAKELSLPVETVRSNPQETREELNTRRIMQDQGMADFASRSPEHAALIVDDPDAWEKVWRQVRAMPEAIGQAWDIGKHNQQFAALGREFMDAPEGKLEEVRTRMAAHRKERQAFIPVDSYADEIALTSAVEQLPRMAEMLPKQAGAAALAGLGGAVAGSVVPVLGTTSAAVASARAGWLAATAYTAFEAERDSTIADFALLQDEDGQYMSRDDVVGAATIYAAGAAAIETAGEAFFLSLAKPFLGGLASKIAPKAFLKTAVQRAMQNKSTRAAVLDIAKRVGQNAFAEGGEESLQGLLQDVMQVVAMAKSDEHGNTSFGEQTVFKTETVKNLVQNFGAGFGAGLWLGGVPMITLGAQDVVAAHRAGLWADEQKALHAQVEATKVKAASPELTKAMLEEGPKLEGNAVIPADALMELHQQDTLILPSLGMEEKAVQQAADMGQELTVPLARLHASLNQNQANAVLDIAREEPQAMNAAEARRLTDRLRTMGERAIAETAGRTEELRARDMEEERLREELTRAVDSVPGLRARIESGEGLQGEAGGVAQFVEDNLRVLVSAHRYLADETGRPLAEFLRPITYEGLDVNSRGQLVPMYKIREEMESEEERARAEADRPFWELVWGRVDPESLKTDYAETYKELRKSKRGLFMPAGRGGVPLDQIADELNERGIFTGSADDLLELLKTKERPRRGYYQSEGMSLQQQDSAVDVVYPNNGLVVGEVTQEMAETLHLNKPGRIVLDDKGVQHIEEEHGQQIRSLGFSGPQAFVEAVLDNVTAVYAVKDNRRKYDLVSTIMQPYGRVMVRLEFDATGDFYSISTAGPIRDTFFKKKTPLWEKAPSSRSENSEPLGNPRAFTGQSSISVDSIAQGGEEVNSLQQAGWHGAGVDFDAFDFSYMGTGEGHQVHGWGGYVAASKDISDRRYRERFAKGVKILANGERIDEDTQKLLEAIISGSVLFEAMESGDFTKFREAVRWYIKHYRQPDRYRTELIKTLQEQIDRIDANPKLSIKAFLEGVPSSDTYRFKSIVDIARKIAKQEGRRAGIADVRERVLAHMEPFVREVRQDLETADKLEALDIDNLEVHQNKGQLFELEIPEEEEMLIEGKAFSEQLPAIQKAILKAFGIGEGKTLDALVQEIDHQLSEIRDKERAATNTWEKAHLAARYDELRRVQYNIETIYELMGKDIYKTLALYLGSPKAASLALLREGVQGISYKGGIDGQAWVIFDEKKMQIVNKLYQRAFHGSPHRFMKFMLDHIGSGEGAQAHGWGLYFAKNRETAEGYRKILATSNVYTFDGRSWAYTNAGWQDVESGEFLPSNDPLALTFDLLDQSRSRKGVMFALEELATRYQELLSLYEAVYGPDEFLRADPTMVPDIFEEDGATPEAKARFDELSQEVADLNMAYPELPDGAAFWAVWNVLREHDADIAKRRGGQLYEVDVPENDVLLDEQKKLAEQPEKVKAALASLGITDDVSKLRDNLFATLEKRAMPGNGQAAVELSKKIFAEVEKGKRPVALLNEMRLLFEGDISDLLYQHQQIVDFEQRGKIDMTGAEIYQALVMTYGSPREASLALNEAGIKGITYVGGQDGRCFVIFDDQAIDMLDTFYQFIGEEGAARLDAAEEASIRMDNLDVARQMEEAGKDAAPIKMATGWERGADGKWRYEIDDSYASLNILYPDMQGMFARSLLSDQQEADLAEKLDIARRVQANPDATMVELFGEDGPKVQRMLFDLGNLDQFVRQTASLLEGDELTLGAILDHEELFTAYPQLRDVRVNIIDDGQSAHGSYSRAANQITLNKAALDDVPLLMHEVQHVIQDEEGFSRGGSPEAFKVNEEGLVDIGRQQMENRLAEARAILDAAPPELQEKMRALNRAQLNKDFDLMDELEAALSEEEYKVWSEYDWLMGEARTLKAEGNQVTPREAYRSLRGEQEAYNTQSRMGMSYEERLASLASSTEDVARKDQIFLQDALGRAMAMGEGTRKAVTRGETVFTPNAMGMDYVVRLFKHANLSTLAHESSHVFFLQMKQLVDEGQASPRMQADYAALCRWVGSKDGFLNRDQHEKLAKGMELFLREGKAPSKKLEGAFGRFRRWLTEVYKAITGPYFQDEQGRQIELNPEVRDVFSRILATQEEVARQAADEVIGRDFTAELDKLGVTGAQRVAITGLVKEAKDMAETRLHEAREAGRKAMQAKWKKEAEAQVAEERIYKARKAMRNSGMNMLALASAVGNEAAGEFFRKLPGIKREGANPWAFAASFGYDSVDQMVQEMLTTPSKAERVEQLVAQKQAEHDKQFKAQSLIASDQAAAMEEMVQEHIIKAMGGKERGVALAQIKQAAREYLAGLPMDDAINSGKFRYQAVRLMHLEREAIMAQDYARAMDINFKLRLNMELTRQSQELRDKTYGIARRAAKFCASKIHNPVCRYAVAFLGMKAGLMPGTKMIARTAQDKDLSMVKAWAAEATDYGYTFEMDEELWYADINPWRHMSLSYFDRVYRQLTQIMTIEQNMRKMDTWQGQQELASVSADLHLHIFGNDPTRQKVGVESDSPKVRRLKKFFHQMLTVATRLKLWDDDKPMGKAWNLIMRPMQEARADELRRFEKASKQIRQIINETYSHEELMAMKDKAFDQTLGESVSKEERLLVLLNLGNAGNRNRLKEGFRQVRNRNKWSDWEIDAMLAPLEKKDYDFAQKIWDHFEQYKKERFDQEESLTGIRPLEVEATPLQTKFGTYRGGYFPIKYDTDRGARAASLDKVNKAAVSMLPSVAHGAMKDRQDKGLGTPLKLRFSVITDAVAESVHDLAFRRPVIEVSKLLRQHPVQEAMEGTQGALVYKQMWDWLNDIAGERPAQNSLDNAASWARSHMAIFAMGFKVTTMLAQMTGLLATTTQLGWKWTMRGVQDTFKHGLPGRAQAAWVDTQARSVMMKNRLQSFDRDVLALTKDLTEAGSSNRFLDPLFRADDWVKKHAFTLTGWVQLWAADLPTWRGAFLKGLEELGMDEKEAALYADTMVETAQGSGATKDLSEIMRSNGMTQLLTVFYSYFNALYNMFYRSAAMAGRHKDLPHVLHTASMALVLWFVEPAITAWLTNRGPEDDEEWWKWWLKEGVQQPFQMIVGVRDISNMIWNSIEGKFGQGYRFSPAADIIEAFGKTAIDLGRVVENVGEGDYEGTKKAAKSLSRDIGMISGTPLLGAQMQTTLGNMWDWLDGSEEFNLQDLFFTRKK